MNTNQTITVSLDLARYPLNQLYNLLGLGLISRAEYLAELDRRKDKDGNIEF